MQSMMMLGRVAMEPVFKIVKKEEKEIHLCRSLIAVQRYDCIAKKYVADFFQTVCFGSKAEYMAKVFSNGDRISLTGEFRNYNYKDVNGTKHYTNYFLIRNLERVIGGDKKKEDSAGIYNQDDLDLSFMAENDFLVICEDMFEGKL